MNIDSRSATTPFVRNRLEHAVENLRAGDLLAAAAICNTVLHQAPEHPDAENLLGTIACLQGDPDRGVQHLRRAVAAASHAPQYHANLARALQDAGDLEGARRSFEEATTLATADAAMHTELAELLANLGRAEEALNSADQAIRIAPKLAAAHVSRGNSLSMLGRLEAALAAYQDAATIDSMLYEPFLNGALVFNRLGRPDAAIPLASRALLLAPRAAPAHFQLGQALRDLRRYDEAADAYRKALELGPEDAMVHHYLGFCLYHLGQLTEAHAQFEHAARLAEHAPETQRFLAQIELARGEAETAAARARDAALAYPDHAELLACLPYCLNMVPVATPAEILDAHRAYDRFARTQLAPFPRPESAPVGTRRIRIGYLSPDFRAHSIAFFLEPILARQDRASFEVHCYHLNPVADAATDRLRALADRWTDCAALNDEQLADRIRDDGIDLLVDLAGHTRDARPTLVARKPAPRQMGFLGYPTSMGLEASDFRVTDGWVDPDGYESFNQERLLRMPQSYFCFRPDASPEVAPPPVERNGFITFGSFNNLVKLNRSVVAHWVDLLGRVEGSRLMLKAAAFSDPTVREKIADRFAAAGLDPQRLILEGHTPGMTEHLARYAEIDIALDTFPYNGATTTCQALWMGVPVVSFVGGTHAGRMGLSILNAAGLPELVGNNLAEYADIAAALAADPVRLGALRRRLRDQLRASALMDESGYVRAFDALCRQAVESTS